jgi:hypothetical protein
MLKKLVSALALTSLAFGSGLCFDPYNHDYGVSTKNFGDDTLSEYNKTVILHNGKMLIDKDLKRYIKLVKYTVKGNKALMLMRGAGEYFVVYTECINGKPVTKDVEAIGFSSSTERVVNLPKYPIKLGFYKDGFWVKALEINWVRHLDQDRGPGGYACDYETDYYPYKLIKEHKTGDAPFKDEWLPTKLCQALGNKYGP